MIGALFVLFQAHATNSSPLLHHVFAMCYPLFAVAFYYDCAKLAASVALMVMM